MAVAGGGQFRMGRGDEAGTRRGVQRQSVGEQAHRLGAGRLANAALQILHPAGAQPGALGQRLLGEASREAVAAQQHPEREGSGRDHAPPRAVSGVERGRSVAHTAGRNAAMVSGMWVLDAVGTRGCAGMCSREGIDPAPCRFAASTRESSLTAPAAQVQARRGSP